MARNKYRKSPPSVEPDVQHKEVIIVNAHFVQPPKKPNHISSFEDRYDLRDSERQDE